LNDLIRIGIIYPLHGAEDDYVRMADMLVPPVQVHVVHTEAVDVHTVEMCLGTGSREHLLAGAEELRNHGVDVCMWACTSGSFVYGLEGAQQQAQQVADSLGMPASSTSLAFVSACRALGLTRVAVASTYPEALAGEFRAFLAEGGIEVVHLGCLGIWSGAEVGRVGRKQVLTFALENDHPGAQAMLIPDTALHTVAFLSEIEAHVGKTVLTANQVTMWEALRLTHRLAPQQNLGRLLESTSQPFDSTTAPECHEVQ